MISGCEINGSIVENKSDVKKRKEKGAHKTMVIIVSEVLKRKSWVFIVAGSNELRTMRSFTSTLIVYLSILSLKMIEFNGIML